MFNGYRKDDDEYNARYKLAYTLYTVGYTWIGQKHDAFIVV